MSGVVNSVKRPHRTLMQQKSWQFWELWFINIFSAGVVYVCSLQVYLQIQVNSSLNASMTTNLLPLTNVNTETANSLFTK